jgi:HSP20 family protein
MSIDRCNFPHMFFLPDAWFNDDAWQPRADVYRMQDGWLIKLELAGVKPDEIRLVAEGDRLFVKGTRRDEHCEQGMGCHCMEISYSRFQRVVELPGLSGAGEIVTSYVDGMLLVRIKTGGRA